MRGDEVEAPEARFDQRPKVASTYDSAENLDIRPRVLVDGLPH